MDYYFGMSESEIRAKQRAEFLKKWRKTEKFFERIGAILFIFAAGLLMAWERPGDELTLMAVGCLLSSAIYLLLVYSRRPDEKRTGLNFLNYDRQSQFAWMASMAAFMLAMQSTRPLMIVAAALLVVLAAWFRWRAHQITQFDKLFAKNNDDNSSDTELEAEQ